MGEEQDQTIDRIAANDETEADGLRGASRRAVGRRRPQSAESDSDEASDDFEKGTELGVASPGDPGFRFEAGCARSGAPGLSIAGSAENPLERFEQPGGLAPVVGLLEVRCEPRDDRELTFALERATREPRRSQQVEPDRSLMGEQGQEVHLPQ